MMPASAAAARAPALPAMGGVAQVPARMAAPALARMPALAAPGAARMAALVSALAILLPAAAHAVPGAQWSKLAGNGAGTLYIDKASVAAVDGGAARKAWTLVSYRKPQTSADGKSYRSLKAQYLYSCGEQRVTLLAQTFYPATMARGEAVGNFKYEQYDAEQPAPASHTGNAYQYVCRSSLPRK